MISILLVKHEVREKDGAKCNKQTLLSNDANTFCGWFWMEREQYLSLWKKKSLEIRN